jgi:hypothetical protein
MRNLKTKLQAENEKEIVESRFNGMFVDLPGSQKPTGGSERNVNCNDYTLYSEGRAGSRKYSDTTKPSGTLYGVCDHKKSGFIIKIYGSKAYVCDKGMNYYEEIYLMKGVSFSGQCEIVEYGENAVIFNSDGIYLIVLEDYFKYVRKMNINLPATLITDIHETESLIYGHRYTWSFLQRSGNIAGKWDRISESGHVIFESGTCKYDLKGKDYGEVFFQSSCYASTILNIIGDFVIPFDTDPDSLTITDIGIYRTKNFGTHTNPPGTGLGGLGNNDEMFVWVKDIPVAKAVCGSLSIGIVTLTQGEITSDDIGCKFSWYDAGGYSSYHSSTIVSIMSASSFVITDQESTFTNEIGGIGNGRLFQGYQSGDRFFVSKGAPFIAGDVGTPIWLADGKVIWIKEYVSATEVKITYSQEIENQAATMYPPTGNVFSRKFNDTTVDDGSGFGEGIIGLEQRIKTGQPLYWPKRFHIPIPSGDIGHIDYGFLFTATRDETKYYYASIGDKRYAAGYYRADHQSETVDTHIKKIGTIGGALTLILSNKTRTLNPQSASDVGNTDNAESIWVIPPSVKNSDKGVTLYGSIVFKGANIIAITNEPAVRIFNGTSWSDTNYAKNQVQKYLESIDQNELVVAVYIPGRQGGYLIWHKRWKRLIPS